ncbi:MAG: ABC transporter ATP-binding protein [Candidatus Lokiarchaeota archaeon]|nr:ABC transporter ATP-binding protein [Candidatus Lokiarchaeota archaeon]
MKYSIETDNLIKDFRNFRVLDDINLKIKSKGCFGYLGPNGSGKTTTMKILCNLLKPTKGFAYLNGINIQKRPKEALMNVGAIISVPPPYPFFTPRIILSYFGEIKGFKKEELKNEIERVINIVKLSDSIDKNTGKFSTGMKQRLNIAAALLGNPDILILDEPTIGLDPIGMMEFRNIIKELKAKKTIFISSHLLFEIEQICDEVILIRKGKIIKQDEIKNIKKMFKSNTFKINLHNRIDKDMIREIESISNIESVKIENEDLYLSFNIDKISPHQIMKNLIDLGLEFDSFTPVKDNLEDFYLKFLNNEGI